MKFTANRRDLLDALTLCAGASNKHAAHPCASSVLLDAGSSLTLTATDLTIATSVSIDCYADEPGVIGLNTHQLLQRVKALPGDEIRISLKNDTIALIEAVKHKRKFSLNIVAATDFPAVPEPGDLEWFEVPASELVTMIKKTQVAVCKDPSRGAVCGALLALGGGTVPYMASVNAATCYVRGESKGPSEFLISDRTLGELKKLCAFVLAKDDNAVIRLGATDDKTFIDAHDSLISSPCPAGGFPPFEIAFEDRGHQRAIVPLPEFQDAVRAIALSADETVGDLKIELEKNKLLLSGESPENGSAVDELVTEYNGAQLSAHASASTLSKILSALDGDTIELRMAGPLDPLILIEDGGKALVMPRKV